MGTTKKPLNQEMKLKLIKEEKMIYQQQNPARKQHKTIKGKRMQKKETG